MNSNVEDMDYMMHRPEPSPTSQGPHLQQPQQSCPAADWGNVRMNPYMHNPHGPFPVSTTSYTHYDPVYGTTAFNNQWSRPPQPHPPLQSSTRLAAEPYFGGVNSGYGTASGSPAGLSGYTAHSHHHIPPTNDAFGNSHLPTFRHSLNPRLHSIPSFNHTGQSDHFSPLSTDRNAQWTPRNPHHAISLPPIAQPAVSSSGQSSPTADSTRGQPSSTGHESRSGDTRSEASHTATNPAPASLDRRDVLPHPHRTMPPVQPWRDDGRDELARRSRHARTEIDEESELDRLRHARVMHEASRSARIIEPGDRNVRQAQLLRGQMPNKRVASKIAIQSLQSVEISSLAESERTCVICYNEFGIPNPENINEAPLRLPKCKHIFGDHCIKKWFEESDSCPYCRDKVHSDPIRHSQEMMRQYLRMRSTHGLGGGGASASGGQGSGSVWGPEMDVYVQHVNRENALMNNTLMREYRRSPPGSTWATAGERRSPPDDLSGTRRRTRPRHEVGGSSSVTTTNNNNNGASRPHSFAGATSSSSAATSHHQSPVRERPLPPHLQSHWQNHLAPQSGPGRRSLTPIVPRQFNTHQHSTYRPQQPMTQSAIPSFASLAAVQFEPSEPSSHRPSYLPSIPFVNMGTQTENQNFPNPLSIIGTPAEPNSSSTAFSQQLPRLDIISPVGPGSSGLFGDVRSSY